MASFVSRELSDLVTGADLNPSNWVADPNFVATNAEQLVQTSGELGVPVSSLFSQVGNNLVLDGPGGTSQIVSVLDETSGSLVEGTASGGFGLSAAEAVANDGSVDAIAAGNTVLGGYMTGLGAASVVAFGFAALSAGLAVWQFSFLRRRLSALQEQIKKLEVRVEAQTEAELEAAVDFLKQADAAHEDKKDRYYHDSLVSSRNVRGYYRTVVSECNEEKADFRMRQFYTRKYFLSLTIELASLVGLEESDEFRRRIEAERGFIVSIAGSFYDDILRGNEPKFLAPQLSDVCSLVDITRLERDAARMGILDSPKLLTTEDVFEKYRSAMSGSLIGRFKPGAKGYKQNATREIVTLGQVLEESKRLLSWEGTIAYYKSMGTDISTVAEEVRRIKFDMLSGDDASHKVFSYGLN